MTTTTASEERIARMEGHIDHMATRADVERVRADLSTDVERVRADLSADIERVRADVERVRADLSADVERVRADVERVRADLTVRIERQSAMLTWRMIMVAGIAQAIGVGALLQFLPRP